MEAPRSKAFRSRWRARLALRGRAQLEGRPDYSRLFAWWRNGPLRLGRAHHRQRPGQGFQLGIGCARRQVPAFPESGRWDYRSFDLDHDVKIIDDALGQRLNAIDPNLKSFKSRARKLILFHGRSDAGIPPTGTIDYYESVAAKMGHKHAESFTRLYMVPGMQHCAGGPGPNSFGNAMTAALQHWVEHGSAPDKILATKYKTDGDPSSGVAQTRPLCPHPQVARYQGSGSIDDAANFACRLP